MNGGITVVTLQTVVLATIRILAGTSRHEICLSHELPGLLVSSLPKKVLSPRKKGKYDSVFRRHLVGSFSDE
jgi:hypothetical protein